jgi:hypothetical protein
MTMTKAWKITLWVETDDDTTESDMAWKIESSELYSASYQIEEQGKG